MFAICYNLILIMQVNSFFEKYILFGFYVLYNIFRVQKFPRFCHESMSFLINIFFFLIAANMTVTGLSETVIALEQLIVILVDTMEADDLRPRLRPLPP